MNALRPMRYLLLCDPVRVTMAINIFLLKCVGIEQTPHNWPGFQNKFYIAQNTNRIDKHATWMSSAVGSWSTLHSDVNENEIARNMASTSGKFLAQQSPLACEMNCEAFQMCSSFSRFEPAPGQLKIHLCKASKQWSDERLSKPYRRQVSA